MDLDRFHYLGLLLGVVFFTFPLELWYGFRVWRDPLRLARVIIPVAVVFLIWDVVSVSRGLWDFNREFVTGLTFFDSFPLEEVLFFVVVPAAAISTVEAVNAQLVRWGYKPLVGTHGSDTSRSTERGPEREPEREGGSWTWPNSR